MSNLIKKLKQKLFKQYRLQVLDDHLLSQTYYKKFSAYQAYLIILTPLLIILVLGVLLMFGNSFTTNFSNNTPSRQDQINYKRQAIQLSKEIDQLKEKLETNNQYINNLRNVMSPDVQKVELDTAIREATVAEQVTKDELLPTKADSILREQVAHDEWIGFSTNNNQNQTFDGLLFPPLKGVVTAGYNISENHLAVDIAAQEGEPIKVAEEGTVIFTDFTTETGYVIIVRHSGNLLTIYKHNSIVYKNIGDFVEKGEVIAAVGNTGELTTGPHLHFEVWIDGKQVDPETYVDF